MLFMVPGVYVEVKVSTSKTLLALLSNVSIVPPEMTLIVAPPSFVVVPVKLPPVMEMVFGLMFVRLVAPELYAVLLVEFSAKAGLKSPRQATRERRNSR